MLHCCEVLPESAVRDYQEALTDFLCTEPTNYLKFKTDHIIKNHIHSETVESQSDFPPKCFSKVTKPSK
jgi:hypothetical protein